MVTEVQILYCGLLRQILGYYYIKYLVPKSRVTQFASLYSLTFLKGHFFYPVSVLLLVLRLFSIKNIPESVMYHLKKSLVRSESHPPTTPPRSLYLYFFTLPPFKGKRSN